ncbi:rCG57931 [Rattus norvegicus]|uniref:RCG57931 n=1 Tax=Rattus norvegicus TaxID=10116 RepID=A6J3R8_RAT|nr:rCG57931 [Rattus norvegicus]
MEQMGMASCNRADKPGVRKGCRRLLEPFSQAPQKPFSLCTILEVWNGWPSQLFRKMILLQ